MSSRAKRSDLSGDDSWSTVATWACFGVLLAAGLIPCVLYTIATHHYLWAAALFLALLPACVIPVFLSLFAGIKDLKFYVGSLYIPSGLWVMLWSVLPEAQGYTSRSLLFTGGFLFILGLLFLLLFFTEGRAADGEFPEDEEAVSG